MEKINWTRVILGGLLAGLIINIFEWLTNGVILEADWAAAMKELGRSGTLTARQIAAFNIWGFLTGIFTIWLYAAIRPRYGAGPKTAICAACAVWALGYFLAAVAPVVLHVFPKRLMAIGLAIGLVEVIAAALAGAWVYQEKGVPMARAATQSR